MSGKDWTYLTGHIKESNAMYLTYHGDQLSKHLKNYKNQKLGNKTEGDTKNLTAQSLKDKDIELISRKVWRKLKKMCSKEKINWYTM